MKIYQDRRIIVKRENGDLSQVTRDVIDHNGRVTCTIAGKTVDVKYDGDHTILGKTCNWRVPTFSTIDAVPDSDFTRASYARTREFFKLRVSKDTGRII